MNFIRSQLERVHWYDDAKSQNHFSRLGIAHGFMGREDGRFNGHSVKQVHGIEILEAKDVETHASVVQKPQADGIYTRENVSLGVQTADCLPILLASTKKTMGMAVHAGWRGLTAGITTQAVRVLREHCPGESLTVVVGPALCSRHFEVGPEVVDALAGGELGFSEEELGYCLTKGKEDRWHVDLAGAAALSLIKLGVEAKWISVLRSCTYEHPQTWVSYRANPQLAKNERIWSWLNLCRS